MTTAYITHPDCLRHEMGPGHPECPARLGAINEHMRASGMLDELRCLEAPLADEDDLKRVHRSAYVDLIFDNAPTEGYAQLDPDTAMNPYSLSAARRAAGAGLSAVDELMAGRSENAFCAVRPCGHHATQVRSMGFCIFNNIAVAAAYAVREKGPRSSCDRRLRRAPRQRHRGHVQPAAMAGSRADGEFFSASLLSVQRHRQSRPQHGQCAAGRGQRRRGGEAGRRNGNGCPRSRDSNRK